MSKAKAHEKIHGVIVLGGKNAKKLVPV